MKARALTDDEIARIRERVRHPRERALFEIGLNAGLRVSEIVALNVGQVWEYGTPVRSLELTDTKGGVHRRVPLNQKAKAAISALMVHKRHRGERLEPEAPLLTNKDDHRLTRRGADRILNNIYNECEIGGHVTTHSLRRTFATRLNRNGQSVRTIQELLGHSKLTTTQDYISVTEDEMADAVGSLD